MTEANDTGGTGAARSLAELAEEALQKVTKWRSFFVGWIWGFKAINDPGVQGMRDLMNAKIVQRVEGNALAALLIEKGVFTRDEWFAQIKLEADELEKLYQKSFPGYRAEAYGLAIDVQKAAETNKRIRMPP
jgi:hypothetical protein